MIRGFIIALAIAGSLCGRAALAQEPQSPSDAAKPPSNPADALAGNWELSNADHDKICRLIFRTETAPGGYRVEIDKGCPNIFPSTKDIAAWTVDQYGNLRLVDAHGEPVIELTEVESGMFDGFKPDEGRYILQAAAAVPVRSAEEMVGDWAIARGTGKPICTLTLANVAATAGAGNLSLKIKPGCAALVTRFGPTSWRMENGDLVLLSTRGQAWRFEENDANTWERVPETTDPVLLVRQ